MHSTLKGNVANCGPTQPNICYMQHDDVNKDLSKGAGLANNIEVWHKLVELVVLVLVLGLPHRPVQHLRLQTFIICI